MESKVHYDWKKGKITYDRISGKMVDYTGTESYHMGKNTETIKIREDSVVEKKS